ncbi:hypothetical protein LOK49_LG05G01573 [Camellia lanceoleosa]|uniref:Uncharacterized protein n=1 Tax=Camellia lanceoleosa TaxID=1840588 RepID=A0ACC0HV36_9ERIC|nr:hypothetical protein LOK49_LG05G01573 [Camellia lanceoleosa]
MACARRAAMRTAWASRAKAEEELKEETSPSTSRPSESQEIVVAEAMFRLLLKLASQLILNSPARGECHPCYPRKVEVRHSTMGEISPECWCWSSVHA